jgi:CBS domain containing-hemolysin-like protein
LVYKDNIDNVVGYVHAFSLFKQPKTIEEVMVDIPIVPETMTAKKLFDLLLKENKSIALVVDEYGGTSGIVTIEDILEEIFGEIEDEFDNEDLIERKISDNEYIFSGRMEIDYINEKYGLNLPTSQEYETIAGLVFHYLGKIPSEGDKLVLGNLEIEVLKVEVPRIDTVRIKVMDGA